MAGLGEEEKHAPVPVTTEWQLLGQTEWQSSTHAPRFDKVLYLFTGGDGDSSRDRELKICVYDVDSETVTQNDCMGWALVHFNKIVEMADGFPVELPLRHDNKEIDSQLVLKRSVVSICAKLEAVATQKSKSQVPAVGAPVSLECIAGSRGQAGVLASQSNETLVVKLGCSRLVKMAYSSKSDPVVAVFARSQTSGQFDSLIAETEWIKDSHDPIFQQLITLPLNTHNPSAAYRFAVYDVDSPVILATDLIGYVDVPQALLADKAVPFQSVSHDIDLVSGKVPGKQAQEVQWHLQLPLTSDSAHMRDRLTRKHSTFNFSIHKSTPKAASYAEADLLGLS